MKFYKLDKYNDQTIASIIKQQQQIQEDSNVATRGGEISLNRILWGNADDGSNIMDTMFVNGSIYLNPGGYAGSGYAGEDDDDDDDSDDDVGFSGPEDQLDMDDFQTKEDDNGGNIYTDGGFYGNKVECKEEVYGVELYLNYPTKTDEKTNMLDVLKYIMPVGSIVMHNGSLTKEQLLKYGWAICDGSAVNGITTPNLKDRFVKGCVSTADVGKTGGSATHTLSVNEMPAHSHTATSTSTSVSNATISPGSLVTGGTQSYSIDGEDGYRNDIITRLNNSNVTVNVTTTTNTTTNISNTGNGNSFNIEPPFYSLIYIMRIA